MQLRRGHEHILELEVRDYECDYQGIVNNAVYLNYLEHARHCAIKAYLNVPQLSQQGIDLVITEVQLGYRRPLRPHDRFTIHSSFALQGHFRLIFEQQIQRSGETYWKPRPASPPWKTKSPAPLPASVKFVVTSFGKVKNPNQLCLYPQYFCKFRREIS